MTQVCFPFMFNFAASRDEVCPFLNSLHCTWILHRAKPVKKCVNFLSVCVIQESRHSSMGWVPGNYEGSDALALHLQQLAWKIKKKEIDVVKVALSHSAGFVS